MASSFASRPLAWLDGDLALPRIPKFTLRKPKRRDRSSRQILKQLHLARTLTKKKSLANKAPTVVDLPAKSNHSPPSIPNPKGTMNPVFVYGLQVSVLISRDRAMLQGEYSSTSETNSPDSTILQRKRALEHAKLVAKQMGQRTSKRCCVKRSGKTSDEELEIFRFTDLPTEIRDMIYLFYFTNNSGEKPSLMWAFKIDGVKISGDFYNAAEKVYYTANNWTFNIRDCLQNSVLGNMDQFHVEMIRKMRIEIPREIQACTNLSSALSRALNISDLTLYAESDTGIRRALHELMPGFKHLRRITVCVDLRRETNRARRWRRGDAHREVREMFDEWLGQEGRLIQEAPRVQEWRWETNDLKKVLKITCPKMHIKFE